MNRFAPALLCPVALTNGQVISFGVPCGFPFNGVVKSETLSEWRQ